MAEPSQNSLISSKPSDSGLTVLVHPLALLTVSDVVTRHSVRNEKGPIAGALLGQQKGREITVEHAFPVALQRGPEGRWQFKYDWMETRIQQYKDVHKAPALEFVGWFTLCPSEGPLQEFVSLQKQATNFYNDNAILLTLHPEAITSSVSTGGKLPIAIYESVSDAETSKDDGSMQVDGQELSDIRFRPVPYSIDTDETEMIAIDYVAKGAGSAAAVDDAPPPSTIQSVETPVQDRKGKKKAGASAEPSETKESNGVEEPIKSLTPEEEDQIASMTTRLNSVKMLESRLHLLREFISSLPPSYISGSASKQPISLTPTSPDPSHLPHLRNIQALLTRLALLTPPSESSPAAKNQPLASASLAQSNDVSLASLLSLLGQDVQSLSELGRKFWLVESNKNNSKSKQGPKSGGGGFGGPMGAAGSGFPNLGEINGGFGRLGSAGVNSSAGGVGGMMT